MPVALRCMSIGELCTGQNSSDRYARLQPLLPQCHSLELRQRVPLGSTVHRSVLEYVYPLAGGSIGGMRHHACRTHGCGRGRAARRDPDGSIGCTGGIEAPNIAASIEFELGCVVALVEELKNRGEDFGDFVRKGELAGIGVVVGGAEDVCEIGGGIEDVDVGSEEAARVMADRDGDCCRVELAIESVVR